MPCERCVSTCMSCNKCEGTNVCKTCNECQTYCELGSQTYSERTENNFMWSIDPHASTTHLGPLNGMFNKNVWNEILNYVNQIRSINGQEAVSLYNPTSGSPFTAAEFNRVSRIVDSDLRVSRGDVIRASYFDTLVAAVNNIEIDGEACRKCDSGCQTCNSCEDCNNDCCMSDQAEMCNDD